MKRCTLIAWSCIVAGCAGAGVGTARQYHVLEAAASSVPAAPVRSVNMTLLVSPTTADGIYGMPQIVYSRVAGTRAHYQLNEWAQPPAQRIGSLLVERMSACRAFGAVTGATDGVAGTLLLNTQLDELYHDATTNPGSAVITLSAVLVDPLRRAVLARRSFRTEAPVEAYDATGAVKAFDRALATLLDDVVEWTRQAAQAAEAATPVARTGLPADTVPAAARASPGL